uniref:Uncharacterized protein n=1 Tax=Nelumbo nucifera TaxID=4432 RepID=A0A822ZKB5_NELNU|nr:TPA_asm: hypothetical protein HUJ06_003547 [Nelumbo nucifera]
MVSSGLAHSIGLCRTRLLSFHRKFTPPCPSSFPPTGVQAMHFYDGRLSYHSSPLAAYPRPNIINPPQLSPPLPSPSSTATRALLLSSVPTDVDETIVRRELEVFGEVSGHSIAHSSNAFSILPTSQFMETQLDQINTHGVVPN